MRAARPVPRHSSALLRQAPAQLEAPGGHSRLIEVAELPAQAILRAEIRDPSLVAAVEAVQAARRGDPICMAHLLALDAALKPVLSALEDRVLKQALQGSAAATP